MPGEQRLQVAASVEGLKRPGRHGEGAVEPVAHAEPAGQPVPNRYQRWGLEKINTAVAAVVSRS